MGKAKSARFILWGPFVLNFTTVHLILVLSMATTQNKVAYRGVESVNFITLMNGLQTALQR